MLPYRIHHRSHLQHYHHFRWHLEASCRRTTSSRCSQSSTSRGTPTTSRLHQMTSRTSTATSQHQSWMRTLTSTTSSCSTSGSAHQLLTSCCAQMSGNIILWQQGTPSSAASICSCSRISQPLPAHPPPSASHRCNQPQDHIIATSWSK